LEELSLVVLRHDIPAHELVAGSIGTIVLAYGDGEAYEVEFVRSPGRPPALLTLSRDSIGPLAGDPLAAPDTIPLA
jgi:hypothetical protein